MTRQVEAPTGVLIVEPPTSPGPALASLSLTMLLPSLGSSIANVALPTLAEAMSTSFQEAQWIVLSYLLAVTTLVVTAGRAGDIAGQRRLLVFGICLFAAASLLGGLASTFWVIIAARSMQGLGAAVMMALALAFVGDLVPRAKVGRTMGLLGATSAIGTALGPSLGGLLIFGAGWRGIFLINVPLGVLAALLARRYLPADRPSGGSERHALDLVGMTLLGLTLGAYALAMTIGRGNFGPVNLALLLTALLGALLFLRAERKAVAPLLRLTAFGDPSLSVNLVLSTLVSMVVMSTLVIGPFYLSVALGLNAARVGAVMSVGPLVAALTGVPAGRLVDRVGAPHTTTAGLTGMAAGTCALSMAGIAEGVFGYLAPIVILTSAYALFQAANNTALMIDSSPSQRGAISGLLNLSRNLGLITGSSVSGAVFAFAAGTSDMTTASPQAIATGMQVTFRVMTVVMLVALAAASGRQALAIYARSKVAGEGR